MQKSTKIDVLEREISVVRTTKKAERDPEGAVCSWTFDLSDYTDAEIWELAARSLVIDAQRLYRAGDLDNEATLTKETFDRPRGPRKPSKKNALEFLKGLSEEEREAFLADLSD